MIDSLALPVLVAGPMANADLHRIASVDPRIEVLHRADLYPEHFDSADPGWSDQPPWTDEQWGWWHAALGRAEVLYDLNWIPDPASLPRDAAQLRWTQATVSGLGSFVQRHGLETSGMTFSTAAGVHAVPLAEHVAYGLLHFARVTSQLEGWKGSRRWGSGSTPELHGRRVLLIGLGAVGAEVARVLAAFGVEVWAMRGGDAPAPAAVSTLVPRTALRSSLAQVWGLVLACPLTPSTFRLIGRDELRAMPIGAVVVNVARGQVIDEPELVAALEDGHLAGAVLDVVESEPLQADSPLWGLGNVLLSPHNAGVSPKEPERLLQLLLSNLERYVAGEPLRNVYQPTRGY